MTRLGLVLAAALLAAGCVTSKAAAPVERPTLEVPHAPPRVIDPAPPPELPLPPVAELPERPTPPVSKPRPAAPARDIAKPDPKLEPPAAEAAPAPQTAAPAPPPLRTAATTDAAAAERQVRDIIRRTWELLKNNIDYSRLTPQRRTAYDQAKDWIDGAEAALKASNYELAKETAEKAEKLAKELQSR